VFIKSLEKPIPTQVRQLILYISNNQGEADGFERELTSPERLLNTFCEIKLHEDSQEKDPIHVPTGICTEGQ